VQYLVTARPANRDSYMFHSANLDAVAAIAAVAGMKYVEIPTHGRKEEELLISKQDSLPLKWKE